VSRAQTTDARTSGAGTTDPETTDAAPAPFTMIGAGPGMACEGDACVVPGTPEDATTA
jgi:hypothetical protein